MALSVLDGDTILYLRTGYGRAVQEEYLPVIGLAAPIWNAQDQVTACLNIWTMIDLAFAAEVEG